MVEGPRQSEMMRPKNAAHASKPQRDLNPLQRSHEFDEGDRHKAILPNALQRHENDAKTDTSEEDRHKTTLVIVHYNDHTATSSVEGRHKK